MQVPEARENKLQDIGTRLQVSCFSSTSVHSTWGLNCAQQGLGSCSFQIFKSLLRASFMSEESANTSSLQKSQPIPPPDSAYLGHFPSSHRHHTCFPRVSPGLPPQRRHLGGSRDQRVGGDPERQGREMVRSHTSRVLPGPARTSQKPRSPSGL